jgi:hypothetical protein
VLLHVLQCACTPLARLVVKPQRQRSFMARIGRIHEARPGRAGMTSGKTQKANLDVAKPHVHARVRKDSLTVDGVTVTRVPFGVGARWSEDVAPVAETRTCRAPHVPPVLSGVLRVRMDDGSMEDFGRNDVMLLPSGHDAWTVGEEPLCSSSSPRVMTGTRSGPRRPGPGHGSGEEGATGPLEHRVEEPTDLPWCRSPDDCQGGRFP